MALEHSSINYDNPFVRSYRRCEETLSKIAMIRSIFTQFEHIISYKLTEAPDQKIVWKEFDKNIRKSNMEGYLYINQIED